MIDNSLVVEIQFELEIEEVASELLLTSSRSRRVVFDTKVEMYPFQFGEVRELFLQTLLRF